MIRRFLLGAFGLMATQWVSANVKLNPLFSNNMVLQRGVEVPIWGTADEGEKVVVSFNGQEKSTVAAGGKWMVKLSPLQAGGPFELKVKGNNALVVSNVLVGEVWLCSGQSNMGFPLSSIKPLQGFQKLDEVLMDAQSLGQIRQFKVKNGKYTEIPNLTETVQGQWDVCDSVKAKSYSAVAFFFARELYKTLKVPIGILNSSYGGTQIENWIPRSSLESDPELKSIFDNFEKNSSEFANKVAKFKEDEPKLWEKYRADSAKAAAEGKKELPRKPAAPSHPAERGGPTGLWNTMVNPLVPYPFKGLLWYQGEANAGRGIQYRTLLPMLINTWRENWAMGNFPAIIVQIPGWKAHNPEIREAQLLTYQKTANSAMTVINDCDDTLDVHPGNKQPVGERAALAARALAYSQKIEYMGPVYESMKKEGSKLVLSFTHLGKGLVAKNGELKDFEIAGADKQYVPAKAVIIKDKVVISADAVAKPEHVRLGWRLCPQVNLYNQEGLPATPFRTDIAPK